MVGKGREEGTVTRAMRTRIKCLMGWKPGSDAHRAGRRIKKN